MEGFFLKKFFCLCHVSKLCTLLIAFFRNLRTITESACSVMCTADRNLRNGFCNFAKKYSILNCIKNKSCYPISIKMAEYMFDKCTQENWDDIGEIALEAGLVQTADGNSWQYSTSNYSEDYSGLLLLCFNHPYYDYPLLIQTTPEGDDCELLLKIIEICDPSDIFNLYGEQYNIEQLCPQITPYY